MSNGIDWQPINLLSRHLGEMRTVLAVADRDLEKFQGKHHDEARSLMQKMRGELFALDQMVGALIAAHKVDASDGELPF